MRRITKALVAAGALALGTSACAQGFMAGPSVQLSTCTYNGIPSGAYRTSMGSVSAPIRATAARFAPGQAFYRPGPAAWKGVASGNSCR